MRTDTQLMKAARSGDDKALDELLARREKLLLRGRSVLSKTLRHHNERMAVDLAPRSG